MRVLICALLGACSAAGVSRAQTAVVQTPLSGDEAFHSVPQTANSTAVLEERVKQLEAQLAAQSAAQQGAAVVQPSLGPDTELAMQPPPAQAAIVVDNSWRYKHYNGTWWYWLPINRWVVWTNDTWVDYDPGVYATQVYSTPSYGGGSGLRLPILSWIPARAERRDLRGGRIRVWRIWT